MNKSKLKIVSEAKAEPSQEAVIRLLLKDHRAMRALMKKIKSHRSSPAIIRKNFYMLEKLVHSHVKAEEFSVLTKIEEHPKFKDHAKESIEEHRIHSSVLSGIRRLGNRERQIIQMKIFCEFLEDHIDEEEEELFPALNKYAALATRKKLGAIFLKKRKQTHLSSERLGSLNPRNASVKRGDENL